MKYVPDAWQELKKNKTFYQSTAVSLAKNSVHFDQKEEFVSKFY